MMRSRDCFIPKLPLSHSGWCLVTLWCFRKRDNNPLPRNISSEVGQSWSNRWPQSHGAAYVPDAGVSDLLGILFNPHKISNETGTLINPIIQMRNRGSGRRRLALRPAASRQQLWESEPRSLPPGFIPVNTYTTWALTTYYESLQTVFLKQKITWYVLRGGWERISLVGEALRYFIYNS